MRVEGDNCNKCDFLKDTYCSRIGEDIDKIDLCITGRLRKVPSNEKTLMVTEYVAVRKHE